MQGSLATATLLLLALWARDAAVSHSAGQWQSPPLLSALR
jgi:hypothetical protein